jgi:16S rRNA (uracil1498-N3)-methyltransferase
MHYFFVASEAIEQGLVKFLPDTARQIQRVLRLKEGELVSVLDNSGMVYEVELVLEGQSVKGSIVRQFAGETESRLRLTLMVSLSQREKYEWILQKGTELGVSAFLPVISERSLVQKKAAIAGKRERWEAIMREAAEQSHRTRLPDLMEAMSLAEAVALPSDEFTILKLCAHTSADATPLREILRNNQPEACRVLIGPEGGFTDAEADNARSQGFIITSLGKRVLRMETAAMAAAAIILNYWVD